MRRSVRELGFEIWIYFSCFRISEAFLNISPCEVISRKNAVFTHLWQLLAHFQSGVGKRPVLLASLDVYSSYFIHINSLHVCEHEPTLGLRHTAVEELLSSSRASRPGDFHSARNPAWFLYPNILFPFDRHVTFSGNIPKGNQLSEVTIHQSPSVASILGFSTCLWDTPNLVK